MDAIKKKMQGMKLEKENALERAVHNEQLAKDANLRAEKAEEEARSLQKKIQQIENDLDQTQEQLTQVNGKLEEKEKALQNCRQDGCHDVHALSSTPVRMSTSRAQGNVKKRGHQHHPRNEGNRRKSALETITINPPLSAYSKANEVTSENKTTTQDSNPNVSKCASAKPKVEVKSKCDIIEVIDLTNCDDDDAASNGKNVVTNSKTIKDERNQKLRKPRKPKEKVGHDNKDMSLVFRPAAEGQECDRNHQESPEDPELEEFAKLRCTSERIEVVAERETRRKNRRCADYPGLAFASSIFSSDTLMKFSIIRNELHNIMNTQLKRVGKTMTTNVTQGSLLDVLKKKMRQTKEEMERYKDECEEYNKRLQGEVIRREEAESEVAALNRRIQLLEEDLERSEERLASATSKLAEASAAADESERIRKALENRTNMEDDRVSILESQLAQAKLIAEEADKKYEEVLENRSLADEERMDALENQLKEARFLAEEADKKYDEVARKLVLMEQDLERAEERAESSDSKIVELEEELRVVGNNLKSLEVSEEKAAVTREHSEDKIRTISDKLREAEARAEFAERSVQKLQKEVDRLEDELVAEKERFKEIGDDLDTAFVELIL
ncbi:unnamed protein product [Brassicogethes aeneus]|uniref:Tropomyosin n=1 Tax=Brassicogethes aeneus TaxID=1431903 RepID=A0A9P0FEX8_BRAAE|nr:unnamed protein product [Brassicogethes aeneus]